MKTLITGGNGFLGSALKSYYPTAVCPRSKDYNLVSQERCKFLFWQYNPDVVIHLAATVGGIGAVLDRFWKPGDKVMFIAGEVLTGSSIQDKAKRRRCLPERPIGRGCTSRTLPCSRGAAGTRGRFWGESGWR